MRITRTDGVSPKTAIPTMTLVEHRRSTEKEVYCIGTRDISYLENT